MPIMGTISIVSQQALNADELFNKYEKQKGTSEKVPFAILQDVC